MEKRGQFYIISAIIIVLVISGIAGITTYAIIKSNPKNIEKLSLDLQTEAPKIIDYGVYNSKDIIPLLNNFTDEHFGPYFLKKTENANVIFVYGNKSDLYSVTYNTTSTGGIRTSVGSGMTQFISRNSFVERYKVIPNGDKIIVVVQEKEYEFKLTEGQMFYFVMMQEKEGERYVEKN